MQRGVGGVRANDDWCRINLDFACALATLLRLGGWKAWPGPFRCGECGEPVLPKGGPSAHFQHLGPRAECPLRHGSEVGRRSKHPVNP